MHLRSLLIALGILAVLGILVSLIPPSAMDTHWGEDSTRAQADELALAMAAFRADFGFLPKGSSAEIFSILSGHKPAERPYVEKGSFQCSSGGAPLDFWRTPFVFEGTRVRSAGRNRLFDGDKLGSDDILSKDIAGGAVPPTIRPTPKVGGDNGSGPNE